MKVNLSRIHENLWVGDHKESLYPPNNIFSKWSAVLCCAFCEADALTKTLVSKVFYDRQMSVDAAASHIMEAAESLNVLLSENDGPVLVHCQAGINRSCSTCAAYAILFLGWEPLDAIEYLRMQNSSIGRPAIVNNSFEAALYFLQKRFKE